MRSGLFAISVFLFVSILVRPASADEMHKHHHHVMGETEHHMEADVMHGKEIKLEAFQFGFSPDTITVKKGDIVKIYVTSRDVSHGFYIKEYNINVPVKKGEVKRIEFLADKIGEFDILCSVYCGRGHSDMKAKLIVKNNEKTSTR